MTKVYDTATDIITFARLQSQNTTSGSSYLGSDGLLKFAAEDEPRIEYGPDGSLKGLLIEEQRTNLVTYSEDFSQWNTNGSISTSAEMTPSGTAATLVPGGVNLWYNPGSTSNAHTVSVFAKAAASNATLQLTAGSGYTVRGTTTVNLTTLAVTSGSGVVEELPNGWIRFSTQVEYSGSNDGFLYFVVTGGVYIYGAQMEQGSFPTSYIPTSGSQQTRSADIASIPVSAFGYNQDAGTVVVSFDTFQDPGDPGSRFVASVGTDGRFCYVNGDYAKAIDGTNVATGGQLYNPGAFTTATAFGVSGISMALDGGSPGTGSFDGSWGSGNDLMLGHLSNASQLNGHIKSLKYFPRRLTNTQLQELTS